MDRKEIANIASRMKSKEDFLMLLNLIKKAEVEKLCVDSSQFHPFTEKQLNFYCNPKHTYHRYRIFKIKKKSGGFRQITAPRTQTFMMMLSAVNEMLRSLYTPSEYAMGFTDGRSVVSNAAIHKGQNYVFNIDLKDFFPSVEQARVWKRLQLAPLNFPVPIANLIAGLCAMKDSRTNEDGTIKHVFVLPQGAPTSPIITNMICDKLDRRLGGLAKRFGLHYTRYADDITFSSMHNVYQVESAFRQELARIIQDQGFTINEKKTRLLKKGTRQEVTGIIVSDKLNVTRKYVRDIRNLLYMWSRYGYSAAYSKFFPKYKEEKGHVKKGNPDMINVIDGKLMYLKMVKGSEDPVYQSLYMKFCVLADRDPNKSKHESKTISYIQTADVVDFEKQNSTKIEIARNEKGKRYAFFMLGNKKQWISINKEITLDDEQKSELLAISSCRGKDNKTFWLLHKKDKVKASVSSSSGVDIDELNSELDSLLKLNM
jgi:retron-type reverse transcriptase/predicted DNA-binding protein (MmcQ/YjbR family)